MSWLTDQFDMLRDFLGTDFRRILGRCALGMAAAAGLGCLLAAVEPEAVLEIMNLFMEQVQEAGVMDEVGNMSVLALLTNNWMAMLFSALYGFIPFLFLPVFSLLANGSLLGMLAVVYVTNDMSLLAYLAGLLPHGIFELPALVLSISCGVCLCQNMCRIVTNDDRRIPLVELLSDLLRVLLLMVLPLTVLAAVMECYVTPLVMEFFM